MCASAPRFANSAMRGVCSPISASVRPTTLMTARRFMRESLKPRNTQRGAPATEVAQNCILLYRGFVIRWPQPNRTCPQNSALCRMQFGDTADYKSALRRRATRTKSLRRKTEFSCMDRNTKYTKTNFSFRAFRNTIRDNFVFLRKSLGSSRRKSFLSGGQETRSFQKRVPGFLVSL